MDRNTIIGLFLIFGILIGYTIFTAPSKEDLAANKRKADSIYQIEKNKLDSSVIAQQVKIVKDSLVAANQDSIPSVKNEAEKFDQLGLFAGSSDGTESFVVIENDVYYLTISNKGGKIKQVQLKDYLSWEKKPLIIYDPDSLQFGFSFFSNNRLINTNKLFFSFYADGVQNPDTIKITESKTCTLALRLYAGISDSLKVSDSYFEYIYYVRGDNYMIDYTVNFRNLEKVFDPGVSILNLQWKSDVYRHEKSLENERNETTIYYKYFQDDVDYLSERKNMTEALKSKVKWIAFKSQFFTSSLISKTAFINADITTLTNETRTSEHYNRTLSANIAVPYTPSENSSFAMQMYFGPNKFNILKKYNLDLQRQVPLGWSFFLMAWINIYAVIPVFDFLGSFGWNYGIIILILTILLKIVLFPIAYKTYKSSAKMRVLKPDVDEINQKFPKSEDAMKKQQAVMALYKKAGVNPMAGCVPMLLQFPILIAMFRFFPSSIELRQEAFLWADDLSSYDSILNLPFNIPFYGDHVSLFTLLMTISTIIYTKLNNDMMGSSATTMPGMKTMMYIMPVMFLGIFNNYSSGLSYYYLLANLITFAQMYLMRFSVDEQKIHAQIEANKKKPVTKSGFQKRLEEMAKNRGVSPTKSSKK